MAITRVQGNARGRTSSGTSFTITLASAPTSGNVLVLTIGTRSKSDSVYSKVSSVTQTGVTWSNVISKTYGVYFNSEIWFGVVGSGASTSIDVSLSSATTGAIGDVCEYSGVATTDYTDRTASASGWGEASSTGTTATTTQADELWIGSVVDFYDQSAPTNGFTLLDGEPYGNACEAYLEKIVSSTGAANSGTTIDSDSGWAGCIATFFASAAPPVGIASKRLLVGVGL